MSEKKVVSRKVVIALGIIYMITVVGLVGAIVNYTRIIADKDAIYNSYVATHSHTNDEYDNYVSTHHHTDSEYNSLLSNYNSYVASHSHTDSEFNQLQSQINSLRAAQLHEVNLKWDFYEPWLGGHYVHIYGAIFNSGTNTAYDVRINVLLYDSNGVLIKSSTIMLGNINGKSYQNVDTNIDYSGHCETYSYQIVHS